jgi:hypothetical protein
VAKLRERTGDSAELLRNLGEAFLWAADEVDEIRHDDYLKRAIESYESSLALRKAKLEYVDYYNLGWAYDEFRLFQKAIEHYSNALALRGDDFDMVYNIAASYSRWADFLEMRLGDAAAAQQRLDEAILWLSAQATCVGTCADNSVYYYFFFFFFSRNIIERHLSHGAQVVSSASAAGEERLSWTVSPPASSLLRLILRPCAACKAEPVTPDVLCGPERIALLPFLPQMPLPEQVATYLGRPHARTVP